MKDSWCISWNSDQWDCRKGITCQHLNHIMHVCIKSICIKTLTASFRVQYMCIYHLTPPVYKQALLTTFCITIIIYIGCIYNVYVLVFLWSHWNFFNKIFICKSEVESPTISQCLNYINVSEDHDNLHYIKISIT